MVATIAAGAVLAPSVLPCLLLAAAATAATPTAATSGSFYVDRSTSIIVAGASSRNSSAVSLTPAPRPSASSRPTTAVTASAPSATKSWLRIWLATSYDRVCGGILGALGGNRGRRRMFSKKGGGRETRRGGENFFVNRPSRHLSTNTCLPSMDE